MPELKSAAIALELAAVTKHYGATVGLDGASFAVRSGSVHALLGENGAGKSTVVKLLSGLLRSDTGEILVRGKPAPIRSPNVAHKLGIQTAFQELSLLPNLSVAKNILLPYEPVSSIRLLRPREARRQAEAIMAKFGIGDVDPGAQVGELDLPVRQKNRDRKAISREPDILLLDEPTSALSASDVEWLFDLVKAATANGTTVLFISHRLREIRAMSSTSTILRNGRDVGTFRTEDISDDEIIRLVMGRTLSLGFCQNSKTEPAAEATGGADVRAASAGAPGLVLRRALEFGQVVGMRRAAHMGRLPDLLQDRFRI